MDHKTHNKCQYLYGSATIIEPSVLLVSKEARRAKQQGLLNQYHTTVVSLTLMAPGPVKNHQGLRFIFYKALRALFDLGTGQGWEIVHAERLLKNTGCEAYWVVNADARAIKQAMIDLEETLSYGRLCDFDVIAYSAHSEQQDDFNGAMVSRSHMGASERKCLVCDANAHLCARSAKHSLEEVLAVIEAMIIASITTHT